MHDPPPFMDFLRERLRFFDPFFDALRDLFLDAFLEAFLPLRLPYDPRSLVM